MYGVGSLQLTPLSIFSADKTVVLMLQNSSVLLGANAPASATAPTVSNTATKSFAVRIHSVTNTDSIKSNGKQMVMYKCELVKHTGSFVSASFTIKYQKSLTGELLVDASGQYIPVDGSTPNVGDEVTVYAQTFINKAGEKRAWFEISRRDSSILSDADAIALLGL